MKTVKMFGKSIPILAIFMSAILVTAGATVVDYLSNNVGIVMTVESPMVVGVSLGESNWGGNRYPQENHDIDDWLTSGILTIDPSYGGETVTLYLMSENLADATIVGFEEVILTNLAGVTAADFVSVVVRVDSIYGPLGYGTAQDLIVLGEGVGYGTIGPNKIRFGSSGDSTWGAGETDVTEILVTFNPAASGTYTITYRIVPAP